MADISSIGAVVDQVIDLTTQGAVVAPPPPKPKRTMPKWESDCRDRLKTSIRRFSKPLADLVARDANEGDTRLLVTDFLCEALGYDKYEDLTTEYQVKGEFADYGVRIDKQLVAFIEVKRCTTKLGQKHLRQVQSYAVNEGVEWMLLTNGAAWQAWHLQGGLPVQTDLVLEVDLLGSAPMAEKVEALFHLSRESLRRQQINDLWTRKRATSPESLTRVLLSEPVLSEIRKELRRQTDHNPAVDDLADLLRALLPAPTPGVLRK